MNRYKFKFFLLLSFTFLLFSCGKDSNSSGGFSPKPIAYGKTNQLVIIADDDIWEGAVGDSLRYYYGGPYLILPQPESIFDLKHYNARDITVEPLRKELSAYIILANLNDTDSPVTQMVMKDIGAENVRRSKEDPSYNCPLSRDRWAKKQLVFYQFGWSHNQLIENIVDNFPVVSKKIENNYKQNIEATVYYAGTNKTLVREVKEKMDADIRVPADYIQAVSDGEIIWLRRNTKKQKSSLLFKRIPYTNKEQLTKEGIKAIRNELTGEYISSPEEGSYVKINDVDLPMFTSVKTIDGNYVLEARGIWEMENAYMAGPFISYLIYNKNKKDLLFIDGFVLAPSKAKRDFMQQMELILNTVKY